MATEPLHAGGHINRHDGRGWVLAGEDHGPDFLVPAAVEPAPLDELQASMEDAPPAQDEAAGQGGGDEPSEEGQGDAEVSVEPERSDEPAPASQQGPAPKPSNAEVRAWAREQGIDVPARGPVPADLVDGYIAATAEDDDEEPTDG